MKLHDCNVYSCLAKSTALVVLGDPTIFLKQSQGSIVAVIKVKRNACPF
jgi:hypothetical protein